MLGDTESNKRAVSSGLGSRSQRWIVVFLVAMISVSTVALHANYLRYPMFWGDDFRILVASWTWDDTWATIWQPANEHAMPLGRLSTWALVQLAGRPTNLPVATALHGPVALIAAMWLVFVFIRRETGSSFLALVGMALFGVSTVYQQAVVWFAASFSLLALDTTLLALLAAQHWRRTCNWIYLLLCASWCALAPAWFASGILAGPLCGLYLLPGFPGRDPHSADISLRRRLALALVPLLGTGAFLAVSLPRTALQIMHLEHYGKKSALDSFHPVTGLWFTLRSLVDNLALGAFGIREVTCPLAVTIAWLVLLAAIGALWWRRAPWRRLLLLGLGFIFCSYWLVYSARAEWGYADNMTQANWSRYHLLPQLGLALFIAAGWRPTDATQLGRRQVAATVVLVGILVASQMPHWRPREAIYDPDQMAVLRRVEETDAKCRTHHISAASARAALDPLFMPQCGSQNSWEMLRGSDDPREISVEEVRRLLAAQ